MNNNFKGNIKNKKGFYKWLSNKGIMCKMHNKVLTSYLVCAIIKGIAEASPWKNLVKIFRRY